jgi:hypothetical protein
MQEQRLLSVSADKLYQPQSTEHPQLIAARRSIAHAPDKWIALEREALRLAPMIERGETAYGKALDYLIDVMDAHGLCGTERERETVEHVTGEGLRGRSAGVGYRRPEFNGATTPLLRPLNLGEFLKMQFSPRRQMLAPWLSEKGEPRRIVYIDGEMIAVEMQHRLAAIVAGFKREAAPEYFKMLSADVTERGLPDLATPEGQRMFDDAIGDAGLAILDNISTLCR